MAYLDRRTTLGAALEGEGAAVFGKAGHGSVNADGWEAFFQRWRWGRETNGCGIGEVYGGLGNILHGFRRQDGQPERQLAEKGSFHGRRILDRWFLPVDGEGRKSHKVDRDGL
jgi:hypothetical protein